MTVQFQTTASDDIDVDGRLRITLTFRVISNGEEVAIATRGFNDRYSANAFRRFWEIDGYLLPEVEQALSLTQRNALALFRQQLPEQRQFPTALPPFFN